MSVLGGYLGAGKTTLVNEVLAGAGGSRVAVVVNDFGAVNVDADLVRSRSEDTLELSNGCVCCSLVDGMSAVMERLRAMAPDRVVLEVSGVGDPAAVAGWADHPGFRRQVVLVCADVTRVRRLAEDRWVADTVRAQLAGADAVLLTRTDVAGADPAATASWVEGVAPAARVLTDRAEALALVLGEVAEPPGSGVARPGQDHEAIHTSWLVEGDAPVATDELWRLVAAAPSYVVRVKGTVRTADGTISVNAVGGDVGLAEVRAAPGRLVVIAAGERTTEPDLVGALRELMRAS